jgi:Ca2+-binding EF-hand superfamily protein
MDEGLRMCFFSINQFILIRPFLFKEQMNELFSRYKDNSQVETIHINRLLEVLQAFGRNPSQQDCERRIHELEDDGKRFYLIY